MEVLQVPSELAPMLKCNTGLGQFGDSPDLVKRALEYLS
jgi:hypothetical protein